MSFFLVRGCGTRRPAGLWQVHIYRLPDLQLLVSERLGGEVIPRSVLFASFEDVPYLLCALGDGQLYNFHVDTATAALR
jgi:DNA damage-binding protein 1